MELRGTLREFNLSDIVQLLQSGRKSGILRVECGAAESALYFDEGTVVHAEHRGYEGEEAFYRLFREARGEFRFQKETELPARTITASGTHLLLEAARLLDESRLDEDPEWRPWVLEDENEWFGIGK